MVFVSDLSQTLFQFMNPLLHFLSLVQLWCCVMEWLWWLSGIQPGLAHYIFLLRCTDTISGIFFFWDIRICFAATCFHLLQVPWICMWHSSMGHWWNLKILSVMTETCLRFCPREIQLNVTLLGMNTTNTVWYTEQRIKEGVIELSILKNQTLVAILPSIPFVSVTLWSPFKSDGLTCISSILMIIHLDINFPSRISNTK